MGLNVKDIAPELLRDMLSSGLSVEIEARGISMFPTLVPRQRLLVVPYGPGRKMRRGDIIAFVSGSRQLVAHRLVGVSGERLVTRGDSISAPDESILPGQVLGLVSKASVGRLWCRVDCVPQRVWGWLQMSTWPVSSRVNHALALVAYRVVKIIGLR